MFNISNFFEKFLNFEKNHKLQVFYISEIINQSTGISIKEDQIKITGDKLSIECSPVFKNEIFMNKSKIEDLLKSRKIFLTIR